MGDVQQQATGREASTLSFPPEDETSQLLRREPRRIAPRRRRGRESPG